MGCAVGMLCAKCRRVQDCVLGRARGGVLAGSFEHVSRDGRENVRCVRRGALRGGDWGAEDREDEEEGHLHCTAT